MCWWLFRLFPVCGYFKAAMNIYFHIPKILFLLGKYLKVRFLGHIDDVPLILEEIAKVSKVVEPEFQFLHIYANILSVINFSHFRGICYNHIVVLTCISLMTNDFEIT